MNDTINFINMEGLKFSGRVNASISHELKNILAIISETAGLLNDLTDLAKQGNDLELSALENCNDSIIEEIQRGFTTIKQMNKFAHSVDVPIKEIDLPETLDLTVKLSGLLSFASKVQINNSDNEIKPVLTCPFLLQNLIYQTLCFIYKSVGLDGEIQINFDSYKNKEAHLIFSNMGHVDLKGFPNKKIQKAANILDVQFGINYSPSQINIRIPYNNDKINALQMEI